MKQSELLFETASQLCEARGNFLIYVQCGPVSVALELPREFALLRRGYVEIWQPYFEKAWRRQAPGASQSNAQFMRNGQISAIWGACTRTDSTSPNDRVTVLVLAWNLAERILLEHDMRAEAVSAYHLDIQWNPNGTYNVCDRLLLRPGVLADPHEQVCSREWLPHPAELAEVVAARIRRHRFLVSKRGWANEIARSRDALKVGCRSDS